MLGAVPRSYEVTPDDPDRRRATQRKVVRPSGRQPERESARRRSGPSLRHRTSPTARIQTASLQAALTARSTAQTTSRETRLNKGPRAHRTAQGPTKARPQPTARTSPGLSETPTARTGHALASAMRRKRVYDGRECNGTTKQNAKDVGRTDRCNAGRAQRSNGAGSSR